MKKLFLLLPLLAGCTSFHVTQTDNSPDEREIKTDIRATAWFSSAQNVTKLKALQTDKTQSFGSDGIGQHGATNMAATISALTELLKAARPTP